MAKCEVCSDNRWVSKGIADIAHPDFGKLFRCPNCVSEVPVGTRDRTGLLVVEKDLQWNSLLDVGNVREVAKYAMEMIDRGSGWLMIYGGSGQAKSQILKIAVSTYRAKHGRDRAVYTTQSSMMDDLREAYSYRDAAAVISQRIKFWSHVKLLALDELGRTKVTDFVGERFFTIINNRYELGMLGSNVTLMASNYPPEELDIGSDKYLQDRMRDERAKVVKMTGGSMRPYMDTITKG